MRYFIDLAYKGTDYHGWQVQNNVLSVQQVLNNVLSTILRSEIFTVGSGRTDAGVHASQQIAHFDTEVILDPEKHLFKFNSMLPADISIKSIHRVTDEAHARFDATKRSYEYKIGSAKNPFHDDLEYTFNAELDIDAMNEASQLLLGTNDFESFSKVHTEVNNFLCSISRAEWKLDNELLTFYVSANRFLRGMVRTMVGTLLDVGMSRTSLLEFNAIIKSKDRTKAGRAVPAKGLFLSEVIYPVEIYIHTI